MAKNKMLKMVLVPQVLFANKMIWQAESKKIPNKWPS